MNGDCNKLSYNYKNGIVIFGEPRSGTTWLTEMLCLIQGTIVNWEPLHPNRGVVPISFKWGYRPFLTEDNTDVSYVKFMEDVFSLQVGNDWTRQQELWHELSGDSVVITKLVHANLLLPWILKNMGLFRKPILIVRHPIDTCISQIRNFSSRHDSTYEVPDYVNKELFLDHKAFIDNLSTPLERKIALWCMNNIPTLNHQCINDEVVVVFYENLVLNTNAEMSRVFENLGVENVPDNIDRFVDIRKPSSSDFRGGYVRDPHKQLEKNFKSINHDTRKRIQRIFDYFEFALYTSGFPHPKWNLTS
ncbi:sulfotransferase [Ulvibacterium sp.]|uniref:sulfotransferase n=1 Tax=Ulvibacterium sp. TaxID=2665914 RepID=UPI003BA92BE7